MYNMTDAGYLAGVFDSIGEVGVSPKPYISIRSVSKEVIDNVADVLYGKVNWSEATRDAPATFEWRTKGWGDIADVVDTIKSSGISSRWRELDLMTEYWKYQEKHGNILQAQYAATTQLFRLQESPVIPLTFDLETMGLKADEYTMLSSSYQWGDDEKNAFSHVKRGSTDEALAVDIRRCLETAPYTIGWNSGRFDIPYLNTRLARYDERPAFIGSHDSADVYYDKKHGNKKRTSLVNAVEQTGVADDDIHKTPIDWEKWTAADRGSAAGMDYVVLHGENDIKLTKRVYNVTMG